MLLRGHQKNIKWIQDMDENELWEWVTRQLKIGEVPEPIRRLAKKDEYVKDALVTDKENAKDGRASLLDFVKERMKFVKDMENWKQGRTPGDEDDEGDPEPPLELGNIESPRSKALEEYIAKMTSCERSVSNFRDWYLNGGVLLPEQARALVSSPAAAYLPPYFFNPQRELHVPLVGHVATPPEMEPVEIDKDGPYTPVKVFVDPPGRVLTAKVRGTKELLVLGEDGRARKVTVSAYSVLNDLRRVSSRLLRWRPWKEEETSWFVLTGEPPAVPAASGRYRASRTPVITYGTITMTIQPWVSATTVRDFYQRLQSRLKEEKPRAPSERNLAVFRFVMDQDSVDVPGGNAIERMRPPSFVRPPWRTLLERWNQMYPEGHRWHYKDVRNFSKDFRRAEKAVIHPAYKIPTSA
jgi:hypothetical protein